MKKCKLCQQEKTLDLFAHNGQSYRTLCKDCYNKKRRKNTPNTGRFKKGDNLGNTNGFKKGHTLCNGRRLSEETKEKIRQANLGKKQSAETVQKRFAKRKVGTSRCSALNLEFRRKVKDRDGWKCTKCGSSEDLHAHHIIPWRQDQSKRFDIDNGITLCCSCHAKEEGFQKGQIAWATGRKMSEESKRKMIETKKLKRRLLSP